MSAETPTAAEVIADHIWCAATRLGSQLGVAEMTCGAPLPPAGRDFHAAHVHERLAEAGLLVTAELALALDQFRNAAQSVATSPAVVTFDRWLAEHDAQVAAGALREAADRLLAGLDDNPLLRGLVGINGGARAMRDYAVESLHEDADRIAGGGEA